jgi:putative membrane-bound dehydrogenase-like protein
MLPGRFSSFSSRWTCWSDFSKGFLNRALGGFGVFGIPTAAAVTVLICFLGTISESVTAVLHEPAPEGTVAGERVLHRFVRRNLTDIYFSEGAAAGEINGDGHVDVVCGPYWYAGPEFSERHEIFPAVPQNVQGYADNFFSWVHDFDGDSAADVLVVGFPGKAAYVFRNPGQDALDRLWEKVEIADQVSNESPQFADLTGDRVPELVCTRDGRYGYYAPTSGLSAVPWRFQAISDAVAPTPFGHGLGVGDVNGDGLSDVIAADGWFEQPRQSKPDVNWQFHKVDFAPAPSDMFAYDVDGDGDQDVITSLNAHEYGLVWHENTGAEKTGVLQFKQHPVMGRTAEENPYGVVFTELHALKLADINGDGLLDIVTGKTYWSHHTGSPMWDAGAVVYWFELRRSSDHSVEYIPHLADGDSGIGRGLVVADVNGDKLPDIVAGGMKGANVLLHQAEPAGESEWQAAQPQRRAAMSEGLAPQEAAAHMTVPPGFRVQLAAGEPMVHQPVAMCFDHRGRLWVAEAHTYPVRAPDGEGRDRIVIFEDTNLDGAYDKSTTFIEGLNLVSGLETGFGGVYVGAAPYLMFIPDRDGDDRPDGMRSGAAQKEHDRMLSQLQFPKDVPPGAVVLRDGFGWQDTHETLNSFIWGPDGWLYGCHGVFTHSLVGKPGESDEHRLPLNAAVWRFHPLRNEFEAFMNGTSNPWGVDFNDRGQAFITACVIPHLWHVVQGGRYHRQGGQHFNQHTYDDIKTIADHAHYVGDIRDHAWWGHEPKSPSDTSAAGGGHAHCGAMVYLGDNWPDQYRNQIFFNNVHGNRVNCDLLEPAGSGFVGHHGKDLLMANDHWYRGINLRYGPDGSVMLIDWYDKNACHRTNPEIWDRTSGRIYRVVHGDQKPVTVNLDSLQDQQLVDLLFHRNEWYVRMARRILMHRGAGSRVNAELKRRLHSNESEENRLRALWTLAALGGLDNAGSQSLLRDPSEYVRAWTIQLLLDEGAADADFLQQLVVMAGQEKSPVVRRYLASALQRIPVEGRWKLAEALAGWSEDAADHNIPLLLWYGAEPLVPLDPTRAVQLARNSKIPQLRRFIVRRAASQPETTGAAVGMLTGDGQSAESQQEVLDEMLTAFRGQAGLPMPDSWLPAYELLSKSDVQAVRDRADQAAVLFGDKRVLLPMRRLLSDPAQDSGRRQEALDVLVRGQDKEAADVLLSDVVLDDVKLQRAAIRALVVVGNDRVPDVLLKKFVSLPEESRRDAAATLCSRPDWAGRLLSEIGSGNIPTGELQAWHVRQILSFENESLNELLRRHWGEIKESSEDRRTQIAAWKSVLKPGFIASGHTGNGRRIFSRTCQNCHRLFGIGGEIGPDITGSNRANLDYLLENMVDPSAVVGRDYQVTVLVLTDGRVINGLVRQETETALTIQTVNDRIVIPKTQIEERSLSKASMMPERQLDSLTKDEVRDLVSYLRSPQQVTLSGPRSPIDPRTGRVPDALEGESLKVIEKTGGTVTGQVMTGFSKDRWSGGDHLWWTSASPGHRLSLEIPVHADGTYQLECVLTRAPDYAVIRLSIDDRILEPELDLFHAGDVVTTGVLTYSGVSLKQGAHRLTFEIIGANPDAVKSWMAGLDYVRLIPEAR